MEPHAPGNADLLWRHLMTVPAFRALLRAVEARFYRSMSLSEPVLDLGCGDGHFAGMVFDRPLRAGVDPWWGPLQKARRSGAYELPMQALGDALPFADGALATVISNSVLEHIQDVQPVLNEAGRVLRPGGRFIMTMPSDQFTANLAGAALLRPVGLAGSYRRFFNYISRHAHTDPPEVWKERLAQAGFAITRWQYYFSRGALRALELGHVQGLPSAVLHFLTGHWIVGPWKENLRLTERWLRPYYEEEAQPDAGAYLFIVAEKQAGRVPQASLPPPTPFTKAELNERAAPPAQLPEAPLLPPAPPPAVMAVEPAGRSSLAAERLPPPPVATTTDAPPAPPARGVLTIGLLTLALLLAVLAQSVLSARPPEPFGGLAVYAYAVAALGALHLVRRRTRPGASIPQQRYFFPLAILLAIVAAGPDLYQGRPLVSLGLWLAAIIAAAYTLAAPLARGITWPRPRLERQEWLLLAGLFLFAFLLRLFAIGDHPFVLNGIEASIGLDTAAALNGPIRNPFATAWLTNPTLPLYLLAPFQLLFGQSVLALRLPSALVGAVTVPVLYLVVSRLFAPRPFGRRAALAAALLLAGSHFHLQYSRLGMTNVWDPLLVLVALALIVRATRHASRTAWLLAGLAVGLNAYFFTASHLLPFMLAALLVYWFVLDRPLLWRQGRHMVAGLALALVVILPMWVYYNANPGIYMERARTLGIFYNGWLLQEAAATGQNVAQLLQRQWWQAALAFNYSLDTSSNYNPGIPLLRYGPALFFAIGLAVAGWRMRRLPYAILLNWWLVTTVFAGALLVSPPDSHRLLVAAPAVIALSALGLTWTVGQVVAALAGTGMVDASRVRRAALAAVVFLVLLFVAADVSFYFGRYVQEPRFADRNTEAAHEIGVLLRDLEGEWTAYFHGAPAMYTGFPTIPYLATNFESGANLFDVEEPGALPAPPRPGSNLIFIYLPERQDDQAAIAGQFPGGQTRAYPGVYSDPLFFTYSVSP